MTQPAVVNNFCDDLFDDGISQGFLTVEMVIERSFCDAGGGQNRFDPGTLEARSVYLAESRLQQELSCGLRIS